MAAMYVLLGAFILVIEGLRRPRHRLDLLFFFHGYFILAYVVTPLFLLHAPEWIHLFPVSESNYSRLEELPWVTVSGYGFFLVGWASGRLPSVRPFSFPVGAARQRKMTVVGLLVGFIGVTGYFYAFGGFWQALALGAQYRYEGLSRVDSPLGLTAVLKHFVYSLVLVLYFSFIQVFLEKRGQSFYSKTLVAAALLLVVYLPVASSRGAVVGIVLGLYTMTALHRGFAISRGLFAMVPVVVVFVLYGKQFFAAFPSLLNLDVDAFLATFESVSDMRIRGGNWFVNTIFKETLHATTSLELAITRAGRDVPFQYFQDYLLLPLSVIPPALLGLQINLPPSVSAVNTQQHGGELIASIPPGLLGSFWYNGGHVAVGGGMFLYGLLGRIVERKFLSRGAMTPGMLLCFVVIATSYGAFATNGDIKVYVFSLFSFVLLVGWLYAVRMFDGLLRSGQRLAPHPPVSK